MFSLHLRYRYFLILKVEYFLWCDQFLCNNASNANHCKTTIVDLLCSHKIEVFRVLGCESERIEAQVACKEQYRCVDSSHKYLPSETDEISVAHSHCERTYHWYSSPSGRPCLHLIPMLHRQIPIRWWCWKPLRRQWNRSHCMTMRWNNLQLAGIGRLRGLWCRFRKSWSQILQLELPGLRALQHVHAWVHFLYISWISSRYQGRVQEDRRNLAVQCYQAWSWHRTH